MTLWEHDELTPTQSLTAGAGACCGKMRTVVVAVGVGLDPRPRSAPVLIDGVAALNGHP